MTLRCEVHAKPDAVCPQASHACVVAMAAAAVPSAAVARAEDALSGSRAPSVVAVCSGEAVSPQAL